VKVDDTNTNTLKGLTNNQRNLVAAKEREIGEVKEHYELKKLDERTNGQNELYEVKDAHQKEILAAVDQKSSRLSSMQQSLKDDLTRLEKEKAILAEQSKLDRDASLITSSVDQDELIQEGLERSREIGRRTNQEVAKLLKDSQWEVAKASEDAKRNLDNAVKQSDNKLADRTREKKIQFTTTEIEHKNKLDQLKGEYDKNSRQVNRLNFVEKSNKEQNHLKDLRSLEEQHNYLLKEKRNQFQQKFAHLESEHNEIMNRTEAKFKEQLISLSNDYASKRSAAEKRSDDPFYNLHRLSHRVEELPDSYIISMDMPEHEADDVLISGRNRDIKLTLSRRFSERLESEEGSVDVNKRSESFTKEFQVADIVDPKSVTRKYENGVLSFKISKA
tara:strand:- start:4333 stop:5499 length:1167 start_codon:yes stop_codon:yes gene_type:complete